jgi:Domain of unknown function (DUF4184)
MPFTTSHPAAVLPLLRTPLPASALVIGSMAPDFPFFLPVDPGIRTHTAVAIVTTDLLFGVPAWLIWHVLLAAPALWAAPRPLRARLTGVPLGVRVRLPNARAVLLTVAALAVGSATHVLWDEFTHTGRWGPDTFPTLGETWWLMPGYRWLQYLSSLVGALVVLAWLANWWRRTPVTSSPDRPAPWWPWALLVGVGVGVGAPVALTAEGLGGAGYDGTTWGGSAALAVALVLAAGWHLRRERVRRSSAA